jgi:hypothetical protein
MKLLPDVRSMFGHIDKHNGTGGRLDCPMRLWDERSCPRPAFTPSGYKFSILQSVHTCNNDEIAVVHLPIGSLYARHFLVGCQSVDDQVLHHAMRLAKDKVDTRLYTQVTSVNTGLSVQISNG